jgi:protein-S-isoprenylcysteine O-methyltransferase Ste14
MIFLRIYLLLGLVVHKAVWELLRKKSDEKPKEPRSLKLTAVKAVKIAVLLGVVIQTMLPDILPISDEPFLIRAFGTSIYTLGLLTALAARFQLGDNWANIETGQVLDRQQVVARGVYSLIRHPIYTGDLLLLLGLELALNSWLVLGILVLAPVVMMQAIKEEKMLVESLPGYDVYCAGTKRFIPFVI